MSVIAIPQRRQPAPAAGPTLTVTFTVALDGESLSPHAFRLLEVVRDLVRRGDDTVTVAGLEPAPVVELRPGRALSVHLASRTVRRAGVLLELTRIEFDLLVFLAQHPRRVFTRRQLLAAVWGHEQTVARTVDVHVRRLRAKVGDHLPLVTTVHGVGYRLADAATVDLVDVG